MPKDNIWFAKCFCYGFVGWVIRRMLPEAGVQIRRSYPTGLVFRKSPYGANPLYGLLIIVSSWGPENYIIYLFTYIYISIE
jgi:hypothetical protein